jgi:hypothetical protein
MRNETTNYLFAWCPQCWDHGDHVKVTRGLECCRCKCVHKKGVVVEDGIYPCRCDFCGDRSATVICDECRLESD